MKCRFCPYFVARSQGYTFKIVDTKSYIASHKCLLRTVLHPNSTRVCKADYERNLALLQVSQKRAEKSFRMLIKYLILHIN